MWERNNGNDESSILQNQFTAYLGTAIRRKKLQYLQGKTKLQHYETSLELQDLHGDCPDESSMEDFLPFSEQFESYKLQQALAKASKRELYILSAKVLEGRSLVEIAAELNMNYNTVAAVYYRMLKRLRKELEANQSEF